MLLDRIAQAAGDLVDRTLEPDVAERLHFPAVTADEVMVVVAVRPRRLIPRDPVARVDSLDQPQVCERLEGAVDGGDPDGPPGPAKAVEDLLRAHTAVLAAQELYNRTARAPAAKAGAFECLERMTGPGHTRQCIVRSVISRIVLILVLAGILAGCGSGSFGGKRSVVAAFYPLAYAAERIGGPAFDVWNLTPPGAEPHDLELTPREVARIQDASVVLYLSHGFQPAVSKAVEQARGKKVDILAGLPLHAAEEAGLTADPHVWLDPILFARVATRIGTALNRPSAALVADLHSLDDEYRQGLRDCTRHEIVTSHAAFGYLASRYGLEQVSITGLAPESEPTPKQLAAVIQVVRRTHATTVFFETLVSPRLADTVAREVGARTAVLDPIEGLTPDEQKRGENYFTLMRQNLAALRKALGCR